MSGATDVWPWTPEAALVHPENDDDTARAAARCLTGAAGDTLIRYLRAITLDRALGPDATDAQLRHLEGQRQLVRHLLALVERGKS